jgi:hypothetical protein
MHCYNIGMMLGVAVHWPVLRGAAVSCGVMRLLRWLVLHVCPRRACHADLPRLPSPTGPDRAGVGGAAAGPPGAEPSATAAGGGAGQLGGGPGTSVLSSASTVTQLERPGVSTRWSPAVKVGSTGGLVCWFMDGLEELVCVALRPDNCCRGGGAASFTHARRRACFGGLSRTFRPSSALEAGS